MASNSKNGFLTLAITILCIMAALPLLPMLLNVLGRATYGNWNKTFATLGEKTSIEARV